MRRSVAGAVGVAVVAAGAVLTPVPATAQQGGRVGVTMGYPAAIGVVWHVSDGLALRPDVSVNWTTTESTNTLTVFPGTTPVVSTSRVDSQSTSVGLSVLVTLHRADRVRVYLAPRGAWVRSTVELDGGLAGALGVDTTTDGWLGVGALGAQVAVHERFAVFGEAGIQYTSQRATSSLTTSRTEDETRTFGLRSAIGVTVYF
ncbi:MAG: hypothetical protein AB7U83_12405 [Vicinamibacterales bacterium]